MELYQMAIESQEGFGEDLEARGGIEPPIMVLQTIALPLGDRATEPKETWNGEGRGEGGPRRPVPCWSKNFRR